MSNKLLGKHENGERNRGKRVSDPEVFQRTRNTVGGVLDMKLDWVSNVSREALESTVIEYLFQLAGKDSWSVSVCVFASAYVPFPIAEDWEQLFASIGTVSGT